MKLPRTRSGRVTPIQVRSARSSVRTKLRTGGLWEILTQQEPQDMCLDRGGTIVGVASVVGGAHSTAESALLDIDPGQATSWALSPPYCTSLTLTRQARKGLGVSERDIRTAGMGYDVRGCLESTAAVEGNECPVAMRKDHDIFYMYRRHLYCTSIR